ncbi:mammalian cell entry protein [Mycobacterium tilburgii]|uniref:mammalian cell entry protein n=1 Tax=Mycobacterium tilburgii TaxID=44467 RepID=UPI0011844B4D|nr:mammalian cell entry protein [Mycobacterium tilburgii]
MEDRQPAAGDLTVDKPAESADTATDAAAEDETNSAATEVDAELVDGDTALQPDPDAEAQAEAAAETKKKRRRRRPLSGKWAAVAVVVATVLFVGSAAFAGATMQPYLSDCAAAATKLKVARTAANAITTLWTYTPENMDSLADRASNYLSGDFEAQYRKFVDAVVAPNKQAKVTNSTQVTGAAVESLDGQNAVVIVYTNTTSTSPLTKNIPALKYLSYRLFMKHVHGRWLVTRMTTVTSLDLAPHP